MSSQSLRNDALNLHWPSPMSSEHSQRACRKDALSPKPLRILFCEDDELIRMLVAEMLKAKGHEVTEAATASEAVGIYRAEAFDVLVTDVGLPDSSGFDLAKALRESSPDLPVLFATGRFDDDAIPSEGCNATILKPYGTNDLLGAIMRLTA